MQNNKIDILINRAKIIADGYFLSPDIIRKVEKHLSVIFPEDFKKLNEIYRYDCFQGFEFYNFESTDEYGVITENLGYRKILNLPIHYIIVCEDDVYMLLFEMQENNMRVIWCGHEEFERLCEGKPMEEDYTIFETFADFYEYLLDEEEKERLSVEE